MEVYLGKLLQVKIFSTSSNLKFGKEKIIFEFSLTHSAVRVCFKIIMFVIIFKDLNVSTKPCVCLLHLSNILYYAMLMKKIGSKLD